MRQQRFSGTSTPLKMNTVDNKQAPQQEAPQQHSRVLVPRGDAELEIEAHLPLKPLQFSSKVCIRVCFRVTDAADAAAGRVSPRGGGGGLPQAQL